MTLDEQFFHAQFLRDLPADEPAASPASDEAELSSGERKLMDLFHSHPGRVLSADTVRIHLRSVAMMPDAIAQALVAKGLLRAVGEGRVAEAYAAR